LHVVEQARGRAEDPLTLFLRRALAEHRQKHLARIALHRQRLIGAAERDHPARLAADLHRWQRDVLREIARRDLVGSDADPAAALAQPRVHAVQPRLFDVAVRNAALARLVAQPTHDRDVIAQRLERLQDERKVGVLTDDLRLPLVLQRAVREVDEAEPRGRRGGRLGERRAGRDHRVEERQRDRRTGALEHGAPGKMLAGQEHGCAPISEA